MMAKNKVKLVVEFDAKRTLTKNQVHRAVDLGFLLALSDMYDRKTLQITEIEQETEKNTKKG